MKIDNIKAIWDNPDNKKNDTEIKPYYQIRNILELMRNNRGHHYATKACQLLFKQARKHDMDYIIITCVPENIASSRTCEIAGGNYIETKAIPKNNEMYEEGKRFVKIFKFEI